MVTLAQSDGIPSNVYSIKPPVFNYLSELLHRSEKTPNLPKSNCEYIMFYDKLKAIFALVIPLRIRYSYQSGKLFHPEFFEEIEAFAEDANIELPPKFKKRLSKYIINIFPVLSLFSALRGERLSEKEKGTVLYLSGFIPLYDDLNDEEGFTHTQIMENAHGRKLISYEQTLLSFFYKKSEQGFGNSELFEKYLELAGKSQDESLEQKSPGNMSASELFKITTNKGGASLLFLRSALKNPFLPGEEEAVFAIGQFIQLMDDLFDTHKDTMAGIVTIPNSSKDIEALRELFDQLENSVCNAFAVLDYPDKNKRQFIAQFRFFVSSIWVCLDQFQNLQDASNGVFSPKSYTRSELICDLEKPTNLWSAFLYGWKGRR